MKQYVVVYWRNDGEYHSKFEYTPHYVFKARNDTQALHIAMAIGGAVAGHRRGRQTRDKTGGKDCAGGQRANEQGSSRG